VAYASHEALIREMKECRRCPLRGGCRQVVTGIGPTDARLMIVGEGPGETEDSKGVPFCGPSGRLLDKILATVGISREECYISNCVHCRTPNNRAPEPGEIAVCKRWLWHEIKFVQPLVIAAMGRTAAKLLLRGGAAFSISKEVSKARHVPYLPKESIVVPCYHPSYLLRMGKRETEDAVKLFAKIKKYMEDH
jgi:uracil-DNA glycosylase family 4